MILHWAAVAGRADLVQVRNFWNIFFFFQFMLKLWLTLQWILDHGATVDPLDDTLWTPLMIASSAGHEEAAKILISKGAKINACTDQWRNKNETGNEMESFNFKFCIGKIQFAVCLFEKERRNRPDAFGKQRRYQPSRQTWSFTVAQSRQLRTCLVSLNFESLISRK